MRISWRLFFSVYDGPVSRVSCGSLSCGASKEHTVSIFRANKLVHVGGELMVARKCVMWGRFVEI
jgi:hypothetical protein